MTNPNNSLMRTIGTMADRRRSGSDTKRIGRKRKRGGNNEGVILGRGGCVGMRRNTSDASEQGRKGLSGWGLGMVYNSTFLLRPSPRGQKQGGRVGSEMRASRSEVETKIRVSGRRRNVGTGSESGKLLKVKQRSKEKIYGRGYRDECRK